MANGREVYVNSNTATDDSSRRFTDVQVFLHDVILHVEGKDQLLGNEAEQTFPMPADSYFGLSYVDVSDIWFKNAKAGANGTMHIIGVEG